MMKLIYTTTSPYARKIRMIILEKDLSERVELQAIDLVADRALLNSVITVMKTYSTESSALPAFFSLSTFHQQQPC